MNQKKAKALRKLAQHVPVSYKKLKKQYNALPKDKVEVKKRGV